MFADDNFKFDENGRKLSKRVENTMGKGEIAHYEQFFLFPQCFQKAGFPGVSKGVVVWEWVNHVLKLYMIVFGHLLHMALAEPHSSVGSVGDLRTEGGWFRSPALANILSEDL